MISKLLNTSQKLVRYRRKIAFLRSLSYQKIDGSQHLYPKVIQLPITYKCNARCVMCNIWNMDHSNEMNVEEFSRYMKDPIFKEVLSVGVNGGEPSLIKNLPEYTKQILMLPSLKNLNIISHGFSPKPLLNSLQLIYQQCIEKGINFHVSISLDGIGDIHNSVRGRPKAFKNTLFTISEIKNNKYLYCDSLDIGCTILKQNVHHLIQLDVFSKKNKLNIKYRLGIENKRIESNKLTNQFSVIYSSERQQAKEFIFSQFVQAKDFNSKYKYFSIFFWLNSKQKKRLLGCIWKNEAITLDSKGSIFYCAVASDKIGSLRKNSGEEIFFDPKNIDYRKSIIKNDCDNCIHDYSGQLEFANFWIYFKSIFFDRYWINLYRFKTLFIF